MGRSPRSPAPADVRVAGRPRALPDAEVVRVVRAVLAGERRRGDISVTFLGRDRMRSLNAEYKGHDRPTDVIAFGLSGSPGAVLGDVYVCPWVAAREASERGIPVREEVIRLVVHGTLHVLGWEHPDGEGRTASPMWRRQEHYVADLA